MLDPDGVEVHVDGEHALGLTGEAGIDVGPPGLDLVELHLGAEGCRPFGHPVGHVGLGDGARTRPVVQRIDAGDAHHLAQQRCN